MPARELPYPVFDADNHFYEPEEALTQVPAGPPQERHRLRRGPRPHQDHGAQPVSDYIPNPTFEVVARPGAQEEYFRHGSGGKSYREVMGKPMKSIPAFRDPAARLEVMDELGLDYALMFPTLASLVEERMKDDPELIHDVIHALNQWMYETWQFDYEGRIFSTPVITLPIVDRALEELEWCLERGASTVLVRPAPVPGYRGTRSFGLEEFDPFWQACVKAGIPVSMHASDSGYSEYLNVWEPGDEFLPFAPTAFRMVAMGKRPIEDAMAALVCHGALSRNPDCACCRSRTAPTGCPTCSSSSRVSTRRCRRASSRIRSRRSGAASTSARSGRTTSPRWPRCGRRPRRLRLGLAAPRGPGGPAQLIDDLQAWMRGTAKGHGRQHDGAVQDPERDRPQAA